MDLCASLFKDSVNGINDIFIAGMFMNSNGDELFIVNKDINIKKLFKRKERVYERELFKILRLGDLFSLKFSFLKFKKYRTLYNEYMFRSVYNMLKKIEYKDTVYDGRECTCFPTFDYDLDEADYIRLVDKYGKTTAEMSKDLRKLIADADGRGGSLVIYNDCYDRTFVFNLFREVFNNMTKYIFPEYSLGGVCFAEQNSFKLDLEKSLNIIKDTYFLAYEQFKRNDTI